MNKTIATSGKYSVQRRVDAETNRPVWVGLSNDLVIQVHFTRKAALAWLEIM